MNLRGQVTGRSLIPDSRVAFARARTASVKVFAAAPQYCNVSRREAMRDNARSVTRQPEMSPLGAADSSLSSQFEIPAGSQCNLTSVKVVNR